MKTNVQLAQPGMNRLATAFGAPTAASAEDRELLTLAQTDLARERLSEAAAKAQAEKNRENYVGNEAQFLSDQTGAPLPLAQRFAQYRGSGNFGTNVDVQPPATGSFDDTEGTRVETPITEAPKDIAPLMDAFKRAGQVRGAVLAGTPSSPEAIAKTGGEYQGQNITDRVQNLIRAGNMDQASAANQGGKLGKEIELYKPIGNTGATIAPSSGAVDTSAAGKVAKAQPAPAGYTWGPADANGQATLVKIKGGPADKPAKASTVGDRMNPAMRATVEMDMKELDNALGGMSGFMGGTASAFFEDPSHSSALSRFFKKTMSTDQQQQYDVYANRIAVAIAQVNSMGRGQLSDAKVAEAKKMVPVPGDTDATIKLKLSQIKRIKELARESLATPIGGSGNDPVQDVMDAAGVDTSGVDIPPAPAAGAKSPKVTRYDAKGKRLP